MYVCVKLFEKVSQVADAYTLTHAGAKPMLSYKQPLEVLGHGT